jgi:hypothetical protein
MDNPPVAPDVAQVLKHNRTLLHIATRLALAMVLFAVPFAAHLVGYDAALPAFGIPAALFVLIFLTLRLRGAGGAVGLLHPADHGDGGGVA